MFKARFLIKDDAFTGFTLVPFYKTAKTNTA